MVEVIAHTLINIYIFFNVKYTLTIFFFFFLEKTLYILK